MIAAEQNGTCNGAAHNGTMQNSTTNGAKPSPGQERIPALAPDLKVNPAELSDLAREMAASFGEMLDSYRKHGNLSPEEARKLAYQASPERIDRILNGPPDQISWSDLDTLAQQDESLALKRWGQIKEAARNEVNCGHYAARAVDDGSPWERARYLAVRAELYDNWAAGGPVYQLLVDQLAQWQILLWRWQEALNAWTGCASYAPRQAKKGKPYETMRITEAEALESAMRNVERLHRLYLRTLKVLEEERRPRPPVVVRHAEQVNVGPVRISVDNLDFFHQSSETPC